MQSGEENSSRSDEEFSSPDCVFKRSSIRKDFPDINNDRFPHSSFGEMWSCTYVGSLLPLYSLW